MIDRPERRPGWLKTWRSILRPKNTPGRMFRKQHAGRKTGENPSSPCEQDKSCEGSKNPRSVVGRESSSAHRRKSQPEPTRPKPSGIDSGTPPRKRPVTHDRFRSTVVSANDVSRWRRGVAPKTARTSQTSKRDAFGGRLPPKSAGSVGMTLKGKESRREATGSSLRSHSARCQEITSKDPGRPRQSGCKRAG